MAAVGFGETEQGQVRLMCHARLPRSREVDRGTTSDDHLGLRGALADELGAYAVEQGADHPGEAEGTARAHRIDGRLANGWATKERGRVKRRQ
jgi:hypothetical protein